MGFLAVLKIHAHAAHKHGSPEDIFMGETPQKPFLDSRIL